MNTCCHHSKPYYLLKKTEEENKVEAAATVVDSKSGTDLYACGRGGCGGRRCHEPRVTGS